MAALKPNLERVHGEMKARDAAGWADPLNQRERAELARMLARHCHRYWDAAARKPLSRRVPGFGSDYGQLGNDLVAASAEMSDLHLDVTERAAVPARADR